jgi:hypothetical protein
MAESDVTLNNQDEVAIGSFPNDVTGMLLGAATVTLGLFLIGTSTSAVTIVVGLALVVIGALAFTL